MNKNMINKIFDKYFKIIWINKIKEVNAEIVLRLYSGEKDIIFQTETSNRLMGCHHCSCDLAPKAQYRGWNKGSWDPFIRGIFTCNKIYRQHRIWSPRIPKKYAYSSGKNNPKGYKMSWEI